MKNALIIHGVDDSVHDNWFPWLANELKKRRYMVWIPQPQEIPAILSKWFFDGDTILIGHSSGVMEILKILQKLSEKISIKEAILVDGFETSGDLGVSVDWGRVKRHCKRFIAIYSDKDSSASLSYTQDLAKHLGGELVIVKDEGNFNVNPKGEVYRKFPQILEYIP